VTGNGWDELWAEFLAEQSRCPDCGSDWDVEGAVEEEGATDEAWVLSLSVSCRTYKSDEAAGRTPAPHPRTRGMAYHELARRTGR
jgi:hypothetical protein